MDAITHYKTQYLRTLTSIPTLKKRWEVYREGIAANIGGNDELSGDEIFSLGSQMHQVFGGGGSGRSQSMLAGAGAAWEGLIAWYLNLLFWDTPVMVIKKTHEFVPETIRNALTVTIGQVPTQTESDLVMFNVPQYERLPEFNLSRFDVEQLDHHIKDKLIELKLMVVQCKTNWNDNAQIPMLWDLIYNVGRGGFDLPHISVGVKGVGPTSMQSFGYAFVTVPTTRFKKNTQGDPVPQHTPRSMAVLRLQHLTGGNYWGYPTEPGVAASVSELPSKLFGDVFSGGVVNHIDGVLARNPRLFTWFLEGCPEWLSP
ncbi:MAG: hypothetical protein CL790_06565 [Chloroflexi bacterium]|nr:hypothetical protein [Chloroflexota bacterium]HCU72293.1 hypothetical protein [Chloroflexota bacterium]